MWLTERLVVFPDLSAGDDYKGPLEAFLLSLEELHEQLGYQHPSHWEAEWLFALRQHLPWVQW
jgi:hypothetical protein